MINTARTSRQAGQQHPQQAKDRPPADADPEPAPTPSPTINITSTVNRNTTCNTPTADDTDP